MTTLQKKNKYSLILILILFISTFNIYFNQSLANNVKIIKSIENEIITNLDIKKEYNYLTALNSNLKNLSVNDGLKIAEESLTREMIKLNEIKKILDIQKLNNNKLVENIIFDIIRKLNLNNRSEFVEYLSEYDLKISEVEKKILIEVLWNQLITVKFKKKLNINEEKLLLKIENEGLLNDKSVMYDLSEIVFQTKNKGEYLIRVEEIKTSILQNGFENTANKFSISDSAKLGGAVGKINQNQLSQSVLKALSLIKENEFTEPINIGNSFLILLINEKKMIEKQIDKNLILKNMKEAEEKKQLQNYSRIYFNKIKINTQINEY
jgi:peptidyl-prolyl cis-trans isomerase SurA